MCAERTRSAHTFRIHLVDFFEQMAEAITAAQETFGTTFTLNGDEVTTFDGVFTFSENTDTLEFGSAGISSVTDAEMIAGKTQFDTAGVDLVEGGYIAVGATGYTIQRVVEDELTFTAYLRRRTL